MAMNKASGFVPALNYRESLFRVSTSFFHSTPVLERRRRTNWDSGSSFRSSPKKFNNYYKRLKNKTSLRDIGDFAEQLFQRWKSDSDFSNHEHFWFRPNFTEDGYRRERLRNKTSGNSRRTYEFCMEEEDEDFSNIFRAAFRGNPYMYWTFTAGGEARFRNSNRYHSRYEEVDDSSDEYEKSSTRDVSSFSSSNRRALGLNISGPLNLEDVKNAYRVCALKWHPDRHQGSSKAAAEEKFKACSAAYESLCRELTLS